MRAGDLSEALSEIELELLNGNTADLLALAGELAAHGGLRQGSLSKAARGYHRTGQSAAPCARYGC